MYELLNRMKDIGEWDWTDPNHPVLLEEHHGFIVARDDICTPTFYGSKTRFIDPLVRFNPQVQEWVFGGSNNHGWGPVSLSCVVRKYGKTATFFQAERKPGNETPTQKLTMELGGNIKWVKMGMLTVTLARARDYIAESPETRAGLPLGLEHEMVLRAIEQVGKSLPISPKEVWTVGSSGTLSRGLQRAFPNANFHVVQVGHAMTEREIGRAKLWISPYKWNQEVKDKDRPPFPSAQYYDAKLWPFVREHASPGALIWNCAPDLY